MKTLPIVWQRLVDPDGQTCPRCNETLDELKRAVATLEVSLPPLGISPSLETREIGAASFEQDPLQSNRIWIAGRPLEDWLGAGESSSPCCATCGDAECRTIELDNRSFEAIPSELILRAALMASSLLLGQAGQAEDTECAPGCCSSGGRSKPGAGAQVRS